MKKTLLMICLVAMCYMVHGQGQGLEDIIVEKYYISDENDAANTDGGVVPSGSVTYRIYVDLAPGYELQSVYGDPDRQHELRIETTTRFFNNTDRGVSVANNILDKYLKNNTVMLDSWMSLGNASKGKSGILKSKDTDGAIDNADGILLNDDSRAGIPLSNSDGMISDTTTRNVTLVDDENNSLISVFDEENSGPILSTYNAGWINASGGVQGPDEDNQILIAQITTDGKLSFKLNLQIRRKSDFKVENWVSSYPIYNDKFIDETYCEKCIYPKETENLLPRVGITSPQKDTTCTTGDMVILKAHATDEDGTVDSVEFFVNGIKIGSSLSTPYYINWTANAGTARITAVATDNSGATDTSEVVNIEVINPNKAPAVSITSPVNGSSVVTGQTVSITADASDEDGTVVLVELYANDVKVSDDATQPYQFDWVAANGTTVLKAVATDNEGAKTTSTLVSVVSTTTGTNEIDNQSFKPVIFPNPTRDRLTIEYEDRGSACFSYTIEIFNDKGSMLLRHNGTTFQGKIQEDIDVSGLAKGAYVILVFSDKGLQFSNQIIKN